MNLRQFRAGQLVGLGLDFGDLAGFTNAARQRCKTVGELWRAALAAGATGVGDDVYQSVLACMPGGAYR